MSFRIKQAVFCISTERWRDTPNSEKQLYTRNLVIVHVDLKKDHDDRENYVDIILDRIFFMFFREIQSIFHDFT